MKTQIKPLRVQLPHARKSLCSRFGTLSAFVAGLALLGGQSQAIAQADNFDDGNDVAAPGGLAWTEYDSVNILFAGAQGVPSSWSFPGGNTYRLQSAAAASATPGVYPGRVSSFAPDTYTDFYESVDVVGWDTSYSQAFGLIARADQLATPGVASLRGYVFGYLNAAVSYPGGADFVAIFRIKTEVSTSGVPGTSQVTGPGTCEALFHLDPITQYRFVFMGRGNKLEGRIYELPDVTTPKLILQADTSGDGANILTSGRSGLMAFNLASAGSPGSVFAGPADVTFDNYFTAPSGCATDNFDDGNDTVNPTLVHYDPLSDPSIGGIPHAVYSFPGGNTYKIHANGRNTPNIGLPAQVGPARAASSTSIDYTSYFSSVDILSWDTSTDTSWGILSRIGNPGLGTTTGYSFAYLTDDHQVGIYRIAGEAPTAVGVEENLTLDPAKQYRMVFKGDGSNLEGRIYDMANLNTPLIVVQRSDATYSHGQSGMVVYDNGGTASTQAADATFDNFVTDAGEPRLKIAVDPFLVAAVSWPGTLGCPTRLESSTDLVTWTAIPLTEIKYTDVAIPDVAGVGERYYKVPGTIDAAGTAFYRLK